VLLSAPRADLIARIDLAEAAGPRATPVDYERGEAPDPGGGRNLGDLRAWSVFGDRDGAKRAISDRALRAVVHIRTSERRRTAFETKLKASHSEYDLSS